jgi:hypothetical protein
MPRIVESTVMARKSALPSTMNDVWKDPPPTRWRIWL